MVSRKPSLYHPAHTSLRILVGFFYRDSLMREIVSVLSEHVVDTVTSPGAVLAAFSDDAMEDGTDNAQPSDRYKLAVGLVTDIVNSPYRQLLVPYFTRVLTFQCGLRARLVSGGTLMRSSFAGDLASGLRNFRPILALLDRFNSISTAYSSVLQSTLAKTLSSVAMKAVTSRISATVDRCGVTQIANDLIDCVLADDQLRHELFAQFLSSERFGDDCAKLRKILTYLFKTASRPSALKFQALFEGGLLRKELAGLQWTPEMDGRGVVSQEWAMRLVTDVVRLFETAQSVARMELGSVSQCQLSAERALSRCFAELPEEGVAAFAKALAVTMNSLLRGGTRDNVPPTKRESMLQSITAVHKVCHAACPLYGSNCIDRVADPMLCLRSL